MTALMHKVSALCVALGIPTREGRRTYAAYRVLERGQQDGMADDMIVRYAKTALRGKGNP